MLQTCVDVHVDLQTNCQLLLSQYKVAVKLINIRINKNQFSSSQAVTCGQMVRLIDEFLQRTVNIPE